MQGHRGAGRGRGDDWGDPRGRGTRPGETRSWQGVDSDNWRSDVRQDKGNREDKKVPRWHRRGGGQFMPNQGQNRGRGRAGQLQSQSWADKPVIGDATSYQDPGVQEVAGKVSKIVGVCQEMCPRSEIILREREGLLHKFETLPIADDPRNSAWLIQESSNVSGSQPGPKRASAGRRSLPKADFNNVVKSFARSAAGQDKTIPEDLRPVLVLKRTVAYLCEEILIRTDSPFPVIYDFIFDRLRAVRQDLVIQRIEDEDAIHILETIVKFHIYSEFRLREEPISTYDPHINQKHLVDCLRKLVFLYEFNGYENPSRAEFEGLNVLVSINSYAVITRAFSIKRQINSPILNLSIEMALSYQCSNWVRFLRKLCKLPVILQMYCLRHVGVMREAAFRTMCLAYGVNSCKIPLSWITTQLLYTSVSELHRDLGHLGVEIIREEDKGQGAPQKYAKFQKSQANVIQSKAAGIKSDIQSSCIQSIVKDNGTLSVLCLGL